MEFQHRMKRTALGTLVQRSIIELQTDPQRALRRLADMGQNLCQGENQQRFIADLQHEIDQSSSPSYAVLQRIATSVNPEVLRTLGMNLGYTAFTYGVRVLRAQQKLLGHRLPSMILFNECEAAPLFPIVSVQGIVEDGIKLGIYSYIFELQGNLSQLHQVVQLARNYAEATFLVCLPPRLVTEKTAVVLGSVQNCIFAVTQDEKPTARACQLLQKNRCAYGFIARVRPDNKEQILSIEQMKNKMQEGCFFGILKADATDESLDRAITTFSCRVRRDSALAIFPIDWKKAAAYLGRSFSENADYLIIDSSGRARSGTGAAVVQIGSLREAVVAVMPSL